MQLQVDPRHIDQPPRRGTLLRRCVRWVWWGGLAAYFLAALVVIGLRYWILPKVPDYRDEIAQAVSARIGERVTIGNIDAGWQRLHPSLELSDVRVHDRNGSVALTLPSITATISWDSLAVWDLRFHSLVLNAPRLAIRRAVDGRFFIAGIEATSGGDAQPSLADWVLRQGELLIRDGEIDWIDEQRGAPLLAMKAVEFRLVNNLLTGRHRIAVRAVPPAALASALDVRADLTGRSLAEWKQWHGQLFAQLDYADLAGWRAWLDYPIRLDRARGGLRFWLGFEDAKIIEATADLALADVQARLAADLPELRLMLLRGRLGAREARQGGGFFRFSDANRTLGYRVKGQSIELVPAKGVALPPLDFSLAWDSAADPQQSRGDFTASGAELAPFVTLAESLPFPRDIRRILQDAEPRGTLSELGLAWTGPIEAPTTFTGKGRFGNLALKGDDARPGFAGLSGTFEATHKGGSVQIGGANVLIDYPAVFHAAPRLEFDTLAATIGWTWSGVGSERALEVKLPGITLANRDIEASITGSWQKKPDAPPLIDITATVPRASIKSIPRYVPFIDGKPLEWLRQALVGGAASAGVVRLKGDLRQFPFESAREGLFEVRAKIADGTLQFADRWPRIESIVGEFAIDGVAMAIPAQSGTINGVPLTATTARIANFFSRDPLLIVDGGAEGNTAEFLKFIAASPVRGLIGGATDHLVAQGNGQLGLRLELPLARMDASKVVGQYQMNANQLTLSADHPPLTQLSGRIDFGSGGVEGRNLAAQFLGGPANFNISTRDDAVIVSGQGTAAIDAVRRAYDPPFLDRVDGSAPYRATVAIDKGVFDLTVESPLTGVSIDLPPPFAKEAAESLPLRIERVISEAQRRDTLTLALGRIVSAQARFRAEGERSVLDRMGVAIGDATVVMPERAGINLTANVRSLDYDRLQSVIAKAVPTAGGGGKSSPMLEGVQVRANEVIVSGRRFNDVGLRATPQADGWRGTIESREASGEFNWRGEEGGRLTARLRTLTMPEATQVAGVTGPAVAAPDKTADNTPRELPAIDLTAERFSVGQIDFGRLELIAVNKSDASGNAWTIEKAALDAPEGKIRATGTWRPARVGPAGDRTEVDVVVDVGDVGKYLARMGQAGAVAGGVAVLQGQLGWNGAPNAIDYPTLAGRLSLHATKGQFVRIEPGIGRLLGVLSLQSLPRRISLDFRDVFSEGFAFDEINSTATVAKGVLSTNDFRMAGPSAAVVMQGETDLARETQNLHVKVVPVIGDSIAAVAGLALLNPVVGLGTLLAQRLLKDPLGQIFAYEYDITGKWDDPKVKQLPRLKPSPNPESGGQ